LAHIASRVPFRDAELRTDFAHSVTNVPRAPRSWGGVRGGGRRRGKRANCPYVTAVAGVRDNAKPIRGTPVAF